MRVALLILAGLAAVSLAGRLTTDSYGIIHDSTTGLEWYVGPDDDMSWFEATEWIEDLSVDGGGWRLPTAQEARSLYDAGISGREAAEIGITNWWIWISGTCRSEEMAKCFSFYDGVTSSDYKNVYNTERALAVR